MGAAAVCIGLCYLKEKLVPRFSKYLGVCRFCCLAGAARGGCLIMQSCLGSSFFSYVGSTILQGVCFAQVRLVAAARISVWHEAKQQADLFSDEEGGAPPQYDASGAQI